MTSFLLGICCGLAMAYPQEVILVFQRVIWTAHQWALRLVEWVQTVPLQ